MALYIACQEGHLEVVKLLLAYGANVHDKNNVSVAPILCIISPSAQ